MFQDRSTDPGAPNDIFRFGDFRLHTDQLLLYHHDRLVLLPPKVVLTLLVLVRAHGGVVSKEALMHDVWPDTFVEEGGLSRNVYLLRRALDEGDRPSHIETVHRRGYRFTREIAAERVAVAAVEHVAVVPAEPQRIADVVPDVDGEMAAIDDAVPADDGDDTETPPIASIPVPTPAASDDEVRPPWYRRRPSGRTILWYAAAAVLVTASPLVLDRIPEQFASLEASPVTTVATKSVAVLPFRYVGDRGADAYLGHGMTDGLTGRLAAVPGLRKRPAEAVLAFAAEDPLAAGRALAVDYVLAGTLAANGESVDVTAQLLAVADSRIVWRNDFHVLVSDIPVLQTRIAEAVLPAMSVPASEVESVRLMRNETRNRKAYEQYAKARYLWHQDTAESAAHAAGHFEEAIRIDPGFALAWAGLASAQAYVPAGFGKGADPESLRKARQSAERALYLDETISSAQRTLGIVSFLLENDYRAAEKSFRHALELEPGNVKATEWLATSLMIRGKGTEAIGLLESALAHDPASPRIHALLAVADYLDRRFNDAITHAESALARNPGLASPRLWRGLALAGLGDGKAALEDLAEAAEHAPESPDPIAALGYVYGQQGNREAAAEMLAKLRTGSFQEPVGPLQFAFVHMGGGDKDAAFEALKGCTRSACHASAHLARVDPRLEPLRNDPRFREIAAVMRTRAAATMVVAENVDSTPR